MPSSDAELVGELALSERNETRPGLSALATIVTCQRIGNRGGVWCRSRVFGVVRLWSCVWYRVCGVVCGVVCVVCGVWCQVSGVRYWLCGVG